MLLRLLCAVLVFVVLVGPAHATVDWDEGFEYATNAAMDVVWSTSCPGNDSIIFPSTDRAHSGSKSLKEIFRGHQGITPGYQSCFKTRNLAATTTGTLYSRFWIYLDNFAVDATQTKMTLHPAYDYDAYVSLWWGMMWGTPNFSVQVQKSWSPPALNDWTENIYGPAIPQNRWVCLETQITFATPGQQNGVVRNWIDDVQGINRTNVWMDQTGQQSVFRGVRLYTQDGVGTIYYDDYAVSRDARIGCGSAPPPPSDTIAPSVPTNVAASATVPLQNNVSWTASTDNVGVQDYTVSYCTGAACTPSLTAGTTSSTGLAHTGLTGGTVYGYRVNARDAAGNISAASSIVYATALSSGGATSLTINSSGKAVLNGTQVFLQGASYMDGGQNGWTSDVDQFAALGYNNLRIFANYAEDTYAGARAVCTADGSLNTTRRDILETFLDYVESKNITITLIIMSDLTHNLIPVDANKQTCVTNVVNAYKHHPLIMFDINNEHMEPANTWINSTAKYATYHTLAKAACPTCIVFASATSPMTHPQDTSADIVASYVDGMLSAGVPILAWHDYRSTNWDTITGLRVTTLRNYVTSKGQPSIGIYFSEPCRLNFAASCNLSASAYLAAAVRARDAGAMGWVWHHEHFDTSTQTLFSQLSVTNAAIASGLASALGTSNDTTPVSLETYDFGTALSTRMSGGIVTADTPVISGGRLRANSTSTESVAVYNGVSVTPTSLFTCTTANAGPPPSASFTTLSGNGLKVISNQCGQNTASTTNVNDAAAWSTPFAGDVVVQATLAALPTDSVLDYAHLIVGAQASTGGFDNMYELEIDRSAGTWRKRVYKVDGSYVQLGATDTSTVSAGAVFKLVRTGTTFIAYQDGVEIIRAEDATFTGGYIGMSSYRETTASTTRWTNFSGGDYVASTTIPANHGITAEVPTATGSNPLYLRLGVRMQNDTNYSGYDCRFNFNPDTVEITRKDSNIPVTLAGPVSATLGAGDIPGCWGNGSTIYATQGAAGATTLLSTTDATYSTGKPYVYLRTAGEPVASLEVDNLTIYEYGPAVPACTPSISAVVASATGATVTYDSACPPTQIRVDTELDTQTLSLSSFPGGVYTRPGGWKLGENFTCLRAFDAQGVVNDTTYGCDGVSEFVPNPDNTAPTMTFVGPTGELPNGTTSAVTSFTTDEAAACRWATTNIAYTAMSNLANGFGLSHSFNATSLSTGANTFYAQCQDQAPQPNTTSTALTITVTVAASTADTTAPSTVTNLVATAVSASQISITHALSTDAGGSPSYAAYISQDGSTYGLALAYTGVPQTISGLSPGTMYYLKVLSIDPSLNPAVAYSNVATATTTAVPDTEAPSDPIGLTIGAVTKNSATISWTPGTDNKGIVNTAVEICSGSAACTAFSLVGTGSGSTFFIGPPLITLTPSTIYRARIKHIDGSGNVSANYSSRENFTTSANTTNSLSVPRAPVAYSQPRLPRVP